MSVQFNPETSSPRFTTAKKCLNTTGAIAGVGVTGALLAKGIRQANYVCGDMIALTNGSKPILTKTGKIYGFFEIAGAKLFGEGTKLGQAIKRYVTGKLADGGRLAHPGQIKAIVTKYKTIGAMALAAGVAGLAILAKACYNHGKLEGKQQ